MYEDPQPTLVGRARFALWILLTCSLLAPFGDLLAGREIPMALAYIHSGRIVIFILLIAAAYSSIADEYQGAIALLMTISLITAGVGAGIIRHNFAANIIMVAAVPLATASILPWGIAIQSVLVGACVIIVTAAWSLVAYPPDSIPANSTITLAGCWAISIFLSYELDRSRRVIASPQRRLETLNRELEKRVHERTEKLRRANEDLSVFTYSISHDLRSPLQTLDGYAELLQDDAGESIDERGRTHLATIRSAAQRMRGLIDAMLRLAQIGRHEPERELVDLSSIAARISTDLSYTQPSRKVHFNIRETPPAFADRVLITNVLDNLLGNAWKYSSGREQAQIEFGYLNDSETPIYYVRDNGIGFDAQQSQRIFEPFQRLQQSEDFQGTGIGLASVYRILRSHNGRVWAEGECGKGAVFKFTLPPPPAGDEPESPSGEPSP